MTTQSFPAFQATGAFAITPHDTQTVDQHTGNTKGYKYCALYTESGGDIKVTMCDGADVTFEGVPAGAFLPIQVIRVWATGTANTTGILGLIG